MVLTAATPLPTVLDPRLTSRYFCLILLIASEALAAPALAGTVVIASKIVLRYNQTPKNESICNVATTRYPYLSVALNRIDDTQNINVTKKPIATFISSVLNSSAKNFLAVPVHAGTKAINNITGDISATMININW